MIKKIIAIMLGVTFFFILFSQIDRLLGYPMATKDMNKIIMQYGKDINRNCEGVIIPESDKKSLYIYFLEIKLGTSKCVIDILEKSQKDTIEIEFSPGGLQMEALYLAHYINTNNIKVKIKSVCNSACTLLLMSSKESSVCYRSKIGFHQSTLKDSSNVSFLNNFISVTKPLEVYENKTMASYGVDSKYYRTILYETPFEEIYYINHEIETTQYGFANKIIDCSSEPLVQIRKSNNIAK